MAAQKVAPLKYIIIKIYAHVVQIESVGLAGDGVLRRGAHVAPTGRKQGWWSVRVAHGLMVVVKQFE